MNFLTSDGAYDLALLALLLMPYGIATSGALGLVIRRWRPRVTEGKALSVGVGLGAFAAALLRDWAHPSWLVYPAIWIVVALFMRPDRGSAEAWTRTWRVLRPLIWTVVVTAALAVLVAAVAVPVAALAAIAWGAWEALRIHVVGYHAAGGVIGLWLGMLVVPWARQTGRVQRWRAWAARPRVAIYAAAAGMLVAGGLWREDVTVPDAWMAVAGLAGALVLWLVRLVRRGEPLLASKAFTAGLIGLGAGAFFMPGGWRWVGEGTIMVGLLVVALGRPHELGDKPHELGRRRWWSLVVLAGTVLLASVDAMALNVALPTIATDLEGATTDDLAWIVDSYLLAFAGLLLTGGNLGDRFGRKRMFRAGLVLFGAASLIAAQAQWVELLIGARIAQGIGVALMSPQGLAIIVAMFVKKGERTTATGIWTAVNGLGVAIGPILGGWLVESYSWRWVFLLNVPVVVVALVATRWVVPETTDRDKPSRLDPVGATLSTAGIGILLWGIIRARSAGWIANEVLLAGGAAALLIGLFVVWIRWRGKHGKSAMLPLSLFKRRYVAATVSMGALYLALFGEVFALTFYLQDVLVYGPLQGGRALLPVAGGILLTTLTSKWLLAKLGRRMAMAGGLALAALALASLVFLSATSGYWWPVGVALVTVGLGMGSVMAAGVREVADALPKAEAGAGGAFDTAVRQTTGALGVALLASFMGYHYAGRLGRDAGGLSLPPEQLTAAGESVTAGVGIATRIAEEAPDLGATFLAIVRDSYVFAQKLGAVTIAAPVVGAMVLLVLWALPRKDQPPNGPDGGKPVVVGNVGRGA